MLTEDWNEKDWNLEDLNNKMQTYRMKMKSGET